MSEPAPTGTPVIVGPGGSQVLERIPLTFAGKGAFDEAWLQRTIDANPSCLPIGEIEPGLAPFTAICRELPVASGYVDNLLMTGAGDIALVEAKLFRNPEARRQAVAQALDYATNLFAMGYDAFQRAALSGVFRPDRKPASLHVALPEAERLEEAAFADAVSHNLRRGRALILVVGDGIRSEAEALLDGMHAHARFGFTLALVELGVFRMPDGPDRYLIRPRTLAKTEIIQRTVVEIVGGGATVKQERSAVPGGVSTEAYWEALESNVPGARAALQKLIAAAEPLGVYPQLLGSLNLKWPRPDEKPVNLGYINKQGLIWTDAAAWFAPRDLARVYVGELASAWNCDLKPINSYSADSAAWTLYERGKPLKLSAVLNRLSEWLGPMGRFIASLRQHEAAEPTYGSASNSAVVEPAAR